VIPFEILYEDNHLIVVNKPAGIPSTHFDGNEETVDLLVKDYLKEKYAKPGNVFLGVVHRLDKPVSGVLAFARTSKAASRLSEQFRDHQAEKLYWAVTEDAPELASGTLEDYLLHDDAAELVRSVKAGYPGSKVAKLHYRILARMGLKLWELHPDTGRKHQLRVQLSSRGWPIIGDLKYGSAGIFPKGMALHARSLKLQHPTKGEELTFLADTPPSWGRFRTLLAIAESTR
jgi:23S rRNA pseudouridine1911/1915/1917 synthase